MGGDRIPRAVRRRHDEHEVRQGCAERRWLQEKPQVGTDELAQGLHGRLAGAVHCREIGHEQPLRLRYQQPLRGEKEVAAAKSGREGATVRAGSNFFYVVLAISAAVVLFAGAK